MSEPAVLVERDEHIVTVTLNRPDKRNAFNAEVLCRCCDAWDLIDGDDEVRAAILTGAGGDFSAGADLDRLVGAMLSGKPAQNEFEERIRQDPGLIFKGFLKDTALASLWWPRSRATATPADWRSCRPPTCGWPPRAPRSD